MCFIGAKKRPQRGSHHWPPGWRSDILDTRLKWLWFPFSYSHFHQQTWLPNANNLDYSKMNLKVTQVYCFKSIYNIFHNRLRLGGMLSNDHPAVGFGSAQIELRDDGIGGWAGISQSLLKAYLTIWFLAADLVAQEGKRKKLLEKWNRNDLGGENGQAKILH